MRVKQCKRKARKQFQQQSWKLTTQAQNRYINMAAASVNLITQWCQLPVLPTYGIILLKTTTADSQPATRSTVSGTVFDHKQLYQQFVLRSIILQPRYTNPTQLRPTPSKPWSCGSSGKQNLIFQESNNRATHLRHCCCCFFNNNTSNNKILTS